LRNGRTPTADVRTERRGTTQSGRRWESNARNPTQRGAAWEARVRRFRGLGSALVPRASLSSTENTDKTLTGKTAPGMAGRKSAGTRSRARRAVAKLGRPSSRSASTLASAVGPAGPGCHVDGAQKAHVCLLARLCGSTRNSTAWNVRSWLLRTRRAPGRGGTGPRPLPARLGRPET
jgi:hypothetical protein